MSRFVVQVVERKSLAVDESQVLSLTEAAKRLGLSVQSVAGLLVQGQLRWVRDTTEPNPRKQGRVSVDGAQQELARRWAAEAGTVQVTRARVFFAKPLGPARPKSDRNSLA